MTGVVDWAQISVGVAAVIGMITVVRSQRRMISDVLRFLSNDMHEYREALTDVCVALERVADRLERLESVVSRR